MVEGDTEVAKNPLHSSEVRLPWGVHVKAHLLDGVGNIGPSEVEVLESPNKALVGHHVADRGIVIEDLCLGVNKRGAMLVVENTIPL
jgi:hypothetical protein